MPNQSRKPSISTKPSENQNTSHCPTSHSPQNHLTSKTAPSSPNSIRQNRHLQSTPKPATLPVLDPAIAKQRQLEDQLSKTKEESLALEKQNLKLRKLDIEFQGQILIEHGKIADLREQLFNAQERSKHLERNAERHELELSRFRDTVSKALKESSIRRRQVNEECASDLSAVLKLSMDNLEGCDHLLAAALGKSQEPKVGSSGTVQSPAEQPQEVTQLRISIFGGVSNSGDNCSDRSASGSTRAPTARMVQDEQAADTAVNPLAVDTGSRKRSVGVESSGEAVLRERGVAKKIRTADQNNPHCEEERFGNSYPGVKSLLAKDDASYQKVLDQLDHDGKQRADDT